MTTSDAPAPPTPSTHAAYVGVAVDRPVQRLFTYRVPADLAARAQVGHRVRVPFRNRTLVGFVVERQDAPELPRVLDVLKAPDDKPLLDDDLLALGAFTSRYYGSSLGEALSAMVPHGVRHRGKGAPRIHVKLRDPLPGVRESLSEPQRRVLRALERTRDGLLLADLCRQARVSNSPVQTLAKHGWVTLEKVRSTDDALLAAAQDAEPESPPTLTDDQATVVRAIGEAVDAQRFQPFCLLGVTGSGKTEVYLRLIAQCVAQGRQAIVLVPEIALTPQTVRRFRRRFERVAVLHSAMTESDRAKTWQKIRGGEADIVIGPRSAIFAPVPRLGLVVVDEEQESSFKQQNAPRYHARDLALVRAKRNDAVVVLGSATPSLETWHNVQRGKYALVRLPERIGGRPLPVVRIVDMRDKEQRIAGGRHLGRTLVAHIDEALAEAGQVLLLQNRRGYATSVSCPRCGHVVECPHCDVGLTYHRRGAVALCHLCGHDRPVPRQCPDCALPRMDYHGAGTQTVEEELASRFPSARIARMDSDTMGTRKSYEDVLGRFGAGEIDILIGTQMIAKGLDFPNVVLVGIISADTALTLPDFRGAERTFQLLAQVAGRAGRGAREGRVIVQSRLPEHAAITLAAAQDFEAFAAKELPDRQAFGYPPHRRLLRVMIRGPQEAAVQREAAAVAERVIQAATRATQVLGPAAPPIARVSGKYRRHVLAKAPHTREVAEILRALHAAPRPRGKVEVQWDVDPTSLL